MFYDEKSDYKGLLPDVFQGIVEINEIDTTVKIQLDKLNMVIKNYIGSKSIKNADLKGVVRWEKILGVSTPLILQNTLSEPLDARRDALLSKLRSKPPINLKKLEEVVESYMGLEVDITVNDYVISIKYRGISRISDLVPLYETMYGIITANLIVSIAYDYLTWDELDEQFLNFIQLDSKNLMWSEFERGEWIV